jgi:hypothetical protein
MNDYDEEIVKCNHCGKRNYYANDKCTHCGKNLATDLHNVMNHIMSLVVVIAILAMVLGSFR